MKKYQWKSEELKKTCLDLYTDQYGTIAKVEFRDADEIVAFECRLKSFGEPYWKLERMGFIEPIPEPVVVLPCPFCGRDPVDDVTPDGRHQITCKTESCAGARLYKIPLEYWNQRAPCGCDY